MRVKGLVGLDANDKEKWRNLSWACKANPSFAGETPVVYYIRFVITS